MLDCVNSKELAQWMAYEKVSGPIGPAYQDTALRAVVELLRQQVYYTGAQFEKNPVDPPSTPYPSPVDFMNAKPDPSTLPSFDLIDNSEEEEEG